ncbi:MAG: ABC transporter permease [Chloroflexota bacterium]|nr:ABC transporter permease [Chloroflexota bacterium]
MSTGLTRYVVRRLIQSVFLLLLISVLSFGLMRLAPGGPAQVMTEDPRISPEYRERLLESFGLNEPMPIQYVKWLLNVARLDFGYSFVDRRPVIEKIAERIPASFQLSIGAFVLGLLGIPLGVVAALNRGRWHDQAIRVFTVLGNAVPHWWLGLMLLVLVASTVRIFPLGGMETPGDGSLADRLWHLALPWMVGALGGWIGYSRYVRSGMLDVLGQDYVRTAYAKGLGSRTVLYVHALRNALIPLMTFLGPSIVGLLSSSLLFEVTFSWPGLGRMAVDAAFQRDYPVLMGLTFIFAALGILANLLSDVAYGWVDPRVRYE